MPKKTFYDALGVAKGATLAEIRAAYRRRAMQVHPDLIRDKQTTQRKLAEDEIRLLNEAYSVLKQKGRRQLYDQCLTSGDDFYEVEQNTRPETEAEREVREASEKLMEIGLKRSVDDTLKAIEALVPRARWTREDPGDQYFDALLAGQAGPARFRIYLKVLPVLGQEDVPGVAQYAEAVLGMTGMGLIREQHCYLMIGKSVDSPGSVYQEMERFNQRCWRGARPRHPRAFLAYTNVDEGRVLAPGVATPEPPVTALKLNLKRHFLL